MPKNEGQYVCEFCNSRYSAKSSLIRHQKSNSNCIKIQEKIQKEKTCEYCEKTFTRKDTVHDHYPTCSIKKEFDMLFNLLEEIDIVLIINKYRCKYCRNLFYSQHSLKEHQKIVKYCSDYKRGLNKEYHCVYCKKKLSRIDSLTRHEKTCMKKSEAKNMNDILDELCIKVRDNVKLSSHERELYNLYQKRIKIHFS